MCGILGVLTTPAQTTSPDFSKRLEDATRLLSHRGPDAGGVKILPEHGVGLGHRRLSILDLDPRSNQPFTSAEGLLHMTYNGEIYNFKALKKELEDKGHRFRTTSDTEVLIEGYKAWGLEELLSRITGLFAFALYDEKKRALFLARDRAGKKPLYYSRKNQSFLFASELKALFHLDPSLKEISPAGLEAYLSLKFVPSPHTLLKDVQKVPPGHYLEVHNGEAKTKRYWQPLPRRLNQRKTLDDLLGEMEKRFTTAVERRLVSDVPVCLFLSGGIDSSLITAYLNKIGVTDMTTYSIGYKNLPAFTELDYSRLVAKKFSINYQEIILDPEDAIETLEDDGVLLDEPVSDWVWVPLHHLSRRAHEDGFKVTMVGEGSDEIFFGYDSMMKGLNELKRAQNPLWKAAARAATPLLAPLYHYSTVGHRTYDRLRRLAAGEPPYLGSSVGFNKTQRHQIVGPNFADREDESLAWDFIATLYREFIQTYASHSDSRPVGWQGPSGEETHTLLRKNLSIPLPSGPASPLGVSPGERQRVDPVNLICYIEFFTKMSEVLLQRVDRITMLHSLEARAPFLDHELVEFAFSIPGDIKIKNHRLKGFLKEFASATLPPEIIQRKKMGFSFPFKEWLRGSLGRHVQDTFQQSHLFRDGWVDKTFCLNLLKNHRAGGRDHAAILWMLFDLCRWYDRWIRR
ncbi:MAG: asparagine synthase (glutamine-hydrolyzing) [Elusimicrobia bacterium]|nr:asparagine synthase (glutamine-hydrolyzing) [Candidatus Obscuribacterium magneticum]MCB4757340.1 asparagine synthase (glutamine-hydrolyzing) [Candidatus Obscuribacterium magneticum]